VWRTIKRIFFGLLTLVVLAVAGVIIAFAVTMSGDSTMSDSETLSEHAKQIKDGFVSAGVIDVGSGGVALVDCGNDKEAKAIVAELGRRNLAKDAVHAIFLTHGHGDHTAGCAAFPKAEVYALAAEKDLVEGRAKGKGPATRFMPAKDTGVRVTHPLADGDEVTVGDVHVTAFALPGHTSGSAAYLADGVLFFGDAATGDKHGKVAPAKYLFSDDQNEAIASLQSLGRKLAPRAADIKTLEFAHSGTLSGFEPLRTFSKL
jgi:glyoxylase-like metal-dependent hydrolase (beta-lactamase superfamily II)